AIPPGPGFDEARAALLGMPSPDKALALALSHIATVSGYVLSETPSSIAAATSRIAGPPDAFARTRDFAGARGPIPLLANASAGRGALNLIRDRDGSVRRLPLAFRLNGTAVASLDAEALRVAQNKRALRLRAGESGALFGQGSGAAALQLDGRDLVTAPDASLWLWYAKDESAGLTPSDLGDLSHMIVYIGQAGDVAPTPFGARSLARIRAEALQSMFLGQVLRRPAAATKAELALLLLVGLAAILVFVRFGIWWTGAFVLGALAAAGAASWNLFTANHVLFDALAPGAGLALVFAAAAGARLVEVSAARKRLHDAFADSLSPPVIQRIARKPALLKLDGEAREVSYLVCGVRGFAALAASFRDDPATFTRLLGRVFKPLMDEVLNHRGTIERLSGDGFSCFWNAPLDDGEHAIHACEAAARMMEVIAKVNEVITHERLMDGTALAPVEIGIGISTGPAIVGGFKSHGRTTYCAVGDCSAQAARIQALSSGYGPAIIVSEETRKAAERGFAFLEVDYVATGVGPGPVKLYAQLGNPVMRASPKFRALATFHDHIFQSLRTQQWDKARELIDQCRKLSGASQKLYDLQLARIGWYEKHPPDPDWDGSFRQPLP
ncbi:MAG: CHASE2 domain-containing protein, partial [Alphaproteobacteria bacterium]|nr:CHASE2 domain-containing protein [Alphaproteobacteria bacterium]